MQHSSPLISCLMVTSASKKRMGHLKLSITSYLSQTYKNRELVIVLDNPEEKDRKQLLSYISSLERTDIRCISPDGKRSLGALRNLSMDNAAGQILCQWDDDDLSHPERVKTQVQFLLANQFDAVLPTNILHIFEPAGFCYWETWDNWIGGFPGALMATKGHGLRYPESGQLSQRGEDAALIMQMKKTLKVGYLAAPAFHYLYFFHGGNTWNFSHHRSIAMTLTASREDLLSHQQDIASGLKDIVGFDLPHLKFMTMRGPALLWTRSTNSLQSLKEVREYRSRHVMLLPGTTQGMSLVHSHTKSLLGEMASPLAQSLTRMTDFRGLEEHAWVLSHSLKSPYTDPAVVHRFLDDAAHKEFLISSDDLKKTILNHSHGQKVHPTPISTLGILTFNRPVGLERCSTGFLKNFREHGRSPRIVVMDDSDQPALQTENTARLKKLKESYPEFEFRYAGLAEKRTFAVALAKESGVDPQVIKFALFNPERLGQKAGANRNALFLQTIGECFVSMDDDVICRICPSLDTDESVAVTSTSDPTLVRLFSDRDALLSKTNPVNCDFLALHEQILGKELGHVLPSRPELPVLFKNLSSRFLNQLEKKAAKLRVSWTGIYGDSGARYPSYYLWKDQEVLRQLDTDAASYHRLAVSREIFRAPKRLTFANGKYCQSTALAYDHRQILPPFMPVLRGEDIIFGNTLHACFTSSLIGYLPWAILHAPLEKRSNTTEEIGQSGRATSFSQILAALMDIFSIPGFERDEAGMLKNLGGYLCDLSKLPLKEFEEILRTCLWRKLTRRIEFLHAQVQDSPDTLGTWTGDIRAHIQVLQSKLTPAGLSQSLLVEECAQHTPEERLFTVQRLTLRFGNLLRAWPSLVEAAFVLKQRETEPALTIS